MKFGRDEDAVRAHHGSTGSSRLSTVRRCGAAPIPHESANTDYPRAPSLLDQDECGVDVRLKDRPRLPRTNATAIVELPPSGEDLPSELIPLTCEGRLAKRRMRILVAHSFYRVPGGEDRYVRQQVELLRPSHDVHLEARANS